MSKPLALMWLALTVSPLGYMFYFASWVTRGNPSTAAQAASEFDRIAVLHVGFIFITWALIASYIVYLFKTTHVQAEKKALWAVVLFLGNLIAMPVFWYLYVWNPTNRES
jgi:uncharacterized membrane protein